jgi:choline dehydrogenase-like flavoprotein
MQKQYEFIIVGSGAGGAVLAKELSRYGSQVLLIERGRLEPKVGTVAASLHYMNANPVTKMPQQSREGVILWRAFMAGGSTVVSCGNATRCLEKELADFGIDLEAEFKELEGDMQAAPLDENLLSDGSRAIAAAAHALGYEMQLMPKFVQPGSCRKCGQCVLGCPAGAKWTTLQYLHDAIENGIVTAWNTRVIKVLVENGRAAGVRVIGPQGEQTIRAGAVILAAGGLASPVILQQSGLSEAGSNLFVDLFENTYGIHPHLNLVREPAMALVDLDFHAQYGFLLSPFVAHSPIHRFIELGPAGLALPGKRLLGLMVKTTDEPAGRVFPDGSVSKPVTLADRARLDHGARIAGEILTAAGCDPHSLVTTRTQGAHPGGTAAIGTVVDTDLQTRVQNLFVCDASVLPAAPGLPPILTIVALAKRLARILTGIPVSLSQNIPVNLSFDR